MNSTCGKYLEDFAIGDTFESVPRIVTADDILTFAGLSGDRNPLHTDPDYAATTQFGKVIAHGSMGVALALGLLEESGLFLGTAIALLDISEWRFLAPIFVGDEVRARMTIVDMRRSRSNPHAGILSRELSLIGRDGAEYQRGRAGLLVRARG